MPAFPLMMLLVFALTLFTSATLLFLIEPMVGKMILPMLGGTPAVWNTCMVFFQAVLLAGYGYAHATTTWLGVRKQAALHLLVVLLPFFFFPLAVNSALIDANSDNPIPGLLALLTVSVGVPFFVISTTAPVISRWFADTDHPSASDPYFLYGASNLGSMLALIGYPALVEPTLHLATQRVWWGVGYGLLVVVTGACAIILWRSNPAVAPDSIPAIEPPSTPLHREGFTAEAPAGKRPDDKVTRIPKSSVTRDKGKETPRSSREADAKEVPLSGQLTWLRRLRWVALAAVPSSLMLGATTYITTDIAAIPLLWVPPLAIYLLSFILVFSNFKVGSENALVFLHALACLGGLGLFFWMQLNKATTPPTKAVFISLFLMTLAGSGASLLLFRNKERGILHKVLVIAMPLLVLLTLFLTMADYRKGIVLTICLHLVTLYSVAMVCHGELARNRPSTAHLTEFFLWMSFGGVLGGMFNALFAPIAFNSIIEYQLAMVLACLLLPALGDVREGAFGLAADAGLAVAFVLAGLILTGLRFRSGPEIDFSQLTSQSLEWAGLAVVLIVLLGGFAIFRTRQHREAAWLDLVLPACLGVLVIGLQLGLPSKDVEPRVEALANLIPAAFRPSLGNLRTILMYALPAVLCYTFVERSLRLGLSVAMLVLASSLCGLFDETTLFQKRSFFGVLKVETGGEGEYEFNRLIHGTTLHGKQFKSDDLRGEALTYYHRTGPIGQVLLAYNGPTTALGAIAGSYPGYHAWPDTTRNIGVIGLGTGTLATYARPGQHMTFYDIDPVVREITFNSSKYFTYVADARNRGAVLELVLGDARLTLDRNLLTPRQKYGVLIVDAFSSDAIPIHLINRESLQIMLSKVTEDGIICYHISNRYLDLEPVLSELCRDAGLVAYVMSDDESSGDPGKTASTWVAIARKEQYLSRLMTEDRWRHEKAGLAKDMTLVASLPDGGNGLSMLAAAIGAALPHQSAPWEPVHPKESLNADRYLFPKIPVGVWTDDYSNILSVFLR